MKNFWVYVVCEPLFDNNKPSLVLSIDRNKLLCSNQYKELRWVSTDNCRFISFDEPTAPTDKDLTIPTRFEYEKNLKGGKG